MKSKNLFLGALCAIGTAGFAYAQTEHRIPPRTEDHFQRNLTVYRIDLEEKINQPLIQSQSPALYAESNREFTSGIIASLMEGYKAGKYLAYDPEDLGQSLTYEQAVEIMQRNAGNVDEEEEDYDYENDSDIIIDDSEDEDITDDFFTSSGGDDVENNLGAYESTLEFISNRIFDKNRSDIVNDIQYVRLVWVDPGETLPDKNFICFKYSDVLGALEATQWKNKYNDAEDRNVREIFELRLFNPILVNVSGRGVRTLPESEFRRNQLLEFEHNLWSY